MGVEISSDRNTSSADTSEFETANVTVELGNGTAVAGRDVATQRVTVLVVDRTGIPQCSATVDLNESSVVSVARFNKEEPNNDRSVGRVTSTESGDNNRISSASRGHS